MKILHIMLSNFYIEGYNYQENALPRQNKLDGHEVQIIASCVSFSKNGESILVQPSSYINKDGIPVIRIQNSFLFSKGLLRRVRKYPNVYHLIEIFSPDVIFYHNCSGWEILTVSKYKKNNPRTRLYLDNHADLNNSGKGWLSLNIQHKLFYKWILHRALPRINKIFYISYESGEFLRNVYGIPKSVLEFYPLGGNLIEPEDRSLLNDRIRRELGIGEYDIIFAHSGKIDSFKRTVDLIRAFSKVKNKYFHLWIFGVLMKDVKSEILKLVEKDSRIKIFGWTDSKKMLDYFCATDLYCQPGSQSATMQNALCCGCAVMLFPHKSHTPYLNDNGFYVQTENDIEMVFRNISKNPEILFLMKKNSYDIARRLLDYRNLASRLYV